MAQDVLSVAWKFMRKRQFATAIKLLEGRAETYEDNFEYYLITGIACLYVGDFGAAGSYFQRARKIKITDTRLILGQAAIYLRRGDTDRALQYYLEVIENDAIGVQVKFDCDNAILDLGKLFLETEIFPNFDNLVKIIFNFLYSFS